MDNYRILMEHSTDGIAIVQDGVLKLVNTAMAQISGYRKEELLGMPLTRLLPAESPGITLPGHQACLACDNVSAIFETQIVPKNGKTRDVQIDAAQTVFDGHPADEIIIRDITDLKRLQKALRESEEKYLGLVENVNDILFELDDQGCFEYVSPSVEKVTQFKAEEIIGQPFSRFIHPDDINGIQLGFECNPEGKIEPRAFRIQNKDGNWRYLMTSSQVKLRDGKPVGITGVMTDVTQRKQAEEALKNREEYFRALTENASDIMVALKEDGHVQFITPSIKNIIGYTVEEVSGENIFKYIYPGDSLQATRLFIYASSNPGYIGQIELRLNHKDGSIRYAGVIVKNALDNPAVRGIILNIQEITHYKQI